MMRVTHLEITDDDNSTVMMEGHRVERHPALCADSHSGDRVVDYGWLHEFADNAVMLGAIGVETLFRFFFRLLCLVLGGLILPTVAELGCITGAAVLCSVGALGRRLSAVAEGAGQQLYHRSVVLALATRVLDRSAQILNANNAKRQLPPAALARRG